MQDLKNLKKMIKENKNYKMLINTNYGGFSLSKEACKELNTTDPFLYTYENRTDRKLIECFEKLGDKFSYDEIKLIEIDFDDILTAYIENYDGKETIVYNPGDFTTPIVEMI